MASDSFDLLADYADSLHLSTLGAPSEPDHFQAVKKATKKKSKSSAISVKPVTDSFIDKKDNIIINSETSEVVEAAFRDLYELLNTKDNAMLKLMRSGNKMLERVVNTVTDWYAYEVEKDTLSRLSKGPNDNLEKAKAASDADAEEMRQEREARKKAMQDAANSNNNDGGGLDIDLDKDKDGKKKRKKSNSRTRPRPNSGPRPSKLKRILTGTKDLLSRAGRSTIGKIAAITSGGLMAAGSIGGFPSFGGTPEPATASGPTPETATTTAETPRATTVAETNGAGTPQGNAATKSIANAMGETPTPKGPSVWKKGLNWIKGATESIHMPKVLGALSVASTAFDAYKVEKDPTLTRDEKNEAHAGQAGQIVGTLGAATAGEVVGGLVGGALGSIFPGAGTIAGAAIGSQIGGLIAGTAASIMASDTFDKAGKSIYDFFVKDVHEDKPQRIQLALDDVKIKTDQDGKETSVLPESITPYTERNYGSLTSGSYSYNGISPQQMSTALAGSPAMANMPGTGILKELKNDGKTESRLSQWNDIFEREGQAQGVDPRLVRAITKQESRGKSDATSHAGAMGLMQLMPGTASDLGVKNAYDPNQAVHGGTKYIAQQLKKYKGNVPLALAAYNAGPGNVDKAIKLAGTTDPSAVLAALPRVTGAHSKETIDYVKNITGYYDEYKTQAPNQVNKDDVPKTDTANQTPTDKQPNPTPKQASVPQPTITEKAPVIDNVQRQDLTKQNETQQADVKTPEPPAMIARPDQSRDGVKVNQTPPNQTTIPTLDDMPLMIDEFGISHLNLGGA